MEHRLTVYLTANTLISALGMNTQENMESLHTYTSGVRLQVDGTISDSPILAATINHARLEERVRQLALSAYTPLEQLFILAIQEVLQQSGADLANHECALLISTTKGNIDLLGGESGEELSRELSGESSREPSEEPSEEPNQKLNKELNEHPIFLWEMAERIGNYFHAAHQVEVVSNACISGVSGLIIAKRWIETGRYKRVIVAGGDLLSHFITSGFLSFKSISSHICRPYDAARDGLNLGEACGAVLLETSGTENDIVLSGGAISNDANHISGPSRTGDGLFFAIRQAMDEAGLTPADVSFVNAHGTGTVYNDEMESKAIHLADLASAPVNSLKPYFGHTLGASGIVETIICMQQLKEGVLLGTLGFEHLGVPMPLTVNAQHQSLSMKSCIKTASGFGGCNAAIALTLPNYKGKQCQEAQCRQLPCRDKNEDEESASPSLSRTRSVTIEKGVVSLYSEKLHFDETDFPVFIRKVYKHLGENNMKFYKMDDLCKLGYVAAGYLLKDKAFQPQEIGILLANASSSLHTDAKHQVIIRKEGDQAASPTTFVYTLPNVVAGEICIRHKIQGENTFFVCQTYNEDAMTNYAQVVMRKGKLKACIIGWCDLLGQHYLADFKLLERADEEEKRD